jgi:hypothetical protein
MTFPTFPWRSASSRGTVCTLIVGLGIAGPGTLLLGANRDESPGRPSTGPARLRDRPSVVGGQDLVAGGTWLAVREGRFVAALLNRREEAAPAPVPDAPKGVPRSRGLLCLDAAAAGPPSDAPATIDPATGEPYPARLDAALRLASREPYAPCTLVGLEPGGASWSIAIAADGPGSEPRDSVLAPGWHVITHRDMDDREEPRTQWLLGRLAGERPRDADEGLALLASLLRLHEDAGAGRPAVCLHRERFPTVSSTLLAIGGNGESAWRARYLHAAGPPCVTPYQDYGELLRT